MSTKALKLRMKNSLRTFPIDDSLFNHFLIEAIKIIQVLNSIPVASRLSGTKKHFDPDFSISGDATARLASALSLFLAFLQPSK
jgi:hypothetical protein